MAAISEIRHYKMFNRATKLESHPIPDAEGHSVGLAVREGVVVYEDGEMAWLKAVISIDGIKGVGTFSQYGTMTFQDGSTITSHTKGTTEVSTSVSLTAKWTGDIIHGTGRFQGIKGTITASSIFLSPEEGELGGKGVVEGVMTFTLSPK